MPSSEELRAQLAMVELEERRPSFKDPDDTSETGDDAAYVALKLEVREARRVYRTLREGRDPYEDAAEGDAVVQPETIKAKAEAN